MSNKKAKVLVIRFSSIGDVVLTTPILRSLKNQLSAEVHFLVKSSFRMVLTNNNNIDQIHILKNDLRESIGELKLLGFDYVIDLQKNIKSTVIARALNVPLYSFNKLNIKKWLAVNTSIKSLPKNVHLVHRYFEGLASLGLTYDGEGLDFNILPEDEYDAQSLVDGLQYQVLVLGATYFTKRIPIEKCQEIIALNHVKTVLLGGNDTKEVASLLASQFPEKTLDFCGKIGLGVSAGIIKHAMRVITGDTGLMHIAAALHKNLIVLWGNTIPDFGMFPLLPDNQAHKYQCLEVLNLHCRPCSKLGFDACPKKHFKCMAYQNIDAIPII